MRRPFAPLSACLALILIVAARPTPAAEPEVWDCRNEHVEVNCGQKKCETSEAHTAMDVTASATLLSVCAYTGCWRGAPSAAVVKGPYRVYVGTALPFSTSQDFKADVAVTIHAETGVASILAAGFSNPAICRKR